TLETINDLGLLRREQKRYEDAGKLLTEALEGRQLKLGPDHPHTLETMHELAVLHMRQDHHHNAERFFVQAAEGRLTKLGAAHPHTKESIKSLVDLYEALEKPEESGKWRAELAQTEAVEE
ncbi:MAG: tetratricopeptide repeat protein, partial [Planctomycetota bacterium]